MPSFNTQTNPRGRPRKKLARAQSKKVAFSKKSSKIYKKKPYRSLRRLKRPVRMSNLDSKNNLELTTLDMFVNNKSKYKTSYALLKDQPLQSFKYTFQTYYNSNKSAQGYNFIDIARADILQQLFSYVPNSTYYVPTGNTNGTKAPYDDKISDNKVILKDGKIFIQNINLSLKIKNACNVGGHVKMYLLKPRNDISYINVKWYNSASNTQQQFPYYNLTDIYNYGVQHNNQIKTIVGGQSAVDGSYLGITPYESCYLTKNFKIMSKYTRSFDMSDGGNINLNLDIPYNKTLSFDRLENSYLDGTTNPSQSLLNKWVKGFSFVIMLVYHGEQGINDNGSGIKTVEVLPFQNLQLLDYKIDFKVCNSIKGKIQQLGAINAPVGGTDKTYDDHGNLTTYSTLI